MKKMVLGILQGLSRAIFVLTAFAVGLIDIAFWGVFFKNGGEVPLDAKFLKMVIFGQELSEAAIAQLLTALNASSFMATLTMVAVSLLLLLMVWPVYLIKQFLLSLKHDQWFHERNTLRLRYLSVYFFIIAVLDVIMYFLAFGWLEGHTLELSIGFSSWLDYFMLGAGLLLLSFMHQQGVKLREEAELTV